MENAEINSVKITSCTKADVPTLCELGRQTFSETFAGTNTAQDMREYLDKNFNESQVLQELTNPASHFFIAWVKGTATAYLKINEPPAQTEKGYPNSLEIHRLYVLKAYKGRRVGSALMGRALNCAREKRFSQVWLGVWEHNEPALRFYRKFGFEVTGKHVFMLGQDLQTDLLLTRKL